MMNDSFSKSARERILELENEVKHLKSMQAQIRAEGQLKYRRLINATSEGYLELDLAMTIVDSNAPLRELTGYKKDELLGKALSDIYDATKIFVHFASRDHLNFEANINGKDGIQHPMLFKRSIIREQDGSESGYLVFLTELRELKEAQQQLREADQRYKKIYQNAAQGMYQTDINGRFIRVNPAFARIFNYDSPSHFLSQVSTFNTLFKNESEQIEFLSEIQKNRVVRDYEIELTDKDGKPVWGLINGRLVEESTGGCHIDSILIDHTKRRLAEERLVKSRERFRRLANQDNLTSLYNTRYLYKTLESLIDQSRDSNTPFSLVFIDMDRFKHVVDTYGHLNGSQALREVGETIRSTLQEPAFGVAYGGDEFVLVLPGADKADALRCAETLRRSIKETIYLTGRDLAVHLSASFGVATFPYDAKDSSGLLALADEAMFRIKAHGKDGIGLSREVDMSAI